MSEPISLMTLFGASKGIIDISIKFAKVLKLIESIESKLDILLQVEFNAAWKTLIQGCNSSSSYEQQLFLINDARNGFTKATCIEKCERLFYAYLGLAICHYLLDDLNNVKICLIEIAKISIYKDIYQRNIELNLGFNRYGMSSVINCYNPINILNLAKAVLTYPSLLLHKAAIQKYNKYRSDLIDDILNKIDAEEKIITMVTKTNQPSLTFKKLESKSLELIDLQKQSLEVLTAI
ncbi:hypothetical protein H6G80_24825 [Nostoc sp. FACHB-87]|uniref:hypothetical protein n=1 Tax=Nostocaceae TaxID=1162 RepID=UPI0016864CC6|nr:MULTISPECIES: hypothetical protein [Nostocaceae]MBD2457287.1 hypothetical protein [Nostoc sp. FACHB-87]MBD2478356.1 hypothetical protein [Anabaena sp. FACHB-83]